MVYLTEIIEVPFKVSCEPVKMSCCAKMKIKQHAKTNNKAPEKCKTPDCNNCINCPLAYVSTFQPGFSTSYFYSAIKNKYPLIVIDLTSDYSCETWKPPNAS